MSSQAPSLSKAEGTGRRPRLHWLGEVWASTVGKKLIVGITGVILAVYVVLHALGNLKALQGAGGGAEGGAPIDRYAEWLRTVGEPVIPREGVLWTVRVILLVALLLHVVGIAQLIARNRAARPPGHRSPRRMGRSLGASTMTLSGILLLGFVVFHVLHLTTFTIEPTPLAGGAVYSNLYGAFQEWWLVAIYVGAVLFLGLHLWHALWSVLQTHGFDKPNRNPTFRRGALLTAGAVTVGFAAIPIAILAGWLPEPGGGAEVAGRGGAP